MSTPTLTPGEVRRATRSRTCHRCGITHAPREGVHPERANYCPDCRPEAVHLGWCPPATRRNP